MIENFKLLKIESCRSNNEMIDDFIETYQGSELEKKLSKQGSGEKRRALFTDIDDTFFRKGTESAMSNLTSLLKDKSAPIIAVTGNDFAGLFKKRLKTGELPYFDAIIGSVGTEIFILHKNEDGSVEYKRDKCFDNMLAGLEFDRKSLVKKSTELIDWASTNMSDVHLDFQHQ